MDDNKAAEKVTGERYHVSLRVLHWLMAFLFIGTFIVGKVLLHDSDGFDPMMPLWLRIHLITGLLLALLLIWRLIIKRRHLSPPPVHTGIGLLDRLAPLVHWALYLVPLLVISSGIVLSIQADLVPVLFLDEGELPRDFHRYSAREIHEITVHVLLVSVVLHVLGALYHHFVKRDGLFRRMWW